jgi:phage-related protein
MALLPILQDLADWFMQMIDQYGPQIVAAFEWIAEIIKQLLPQFFALVDFLANQLPAATQGLQETWAEVWPVLQELAQIFVQWFQDNLPLIIETGRTLLDFWQNSVVPTLDNVWAIIVEIVSTAINTVLNVVALVMQVITGDWEAAWMTIQEIASTIWQAILTISSEFIEAVANFVGTTTEEIKAQWQSNWQMVLTIVQAIWDNILSAVQDRIEAVRKTVMDKIEAIKSGLNAQISAFRAVGEALIDGIKEGVLAAAGRLVQAAVDAVRKALQAAKDAVGISSPSRVFRQQVGQAIGAGIALGIGDLTPAIQAQIVRAVVPGGAGGGGSRITSTSITNAPSFNLTTQSTTRPGALSMEFGAMEAAYRVTR